MLVRTLEKNVNLIPLTLFDLNILWTQYRKLYYFYAPEVNLCTRESDGTQGEGKPVAEQVL